MMDFEKQRIELEKAAKSADLKNKEHKQQVDSLIRILDDAKEKSERSEAEYRNKIEEFIAEKNKLISEKDKALEEKDNYFEEYRKMREEKEELNRKLYEEHQLFEKILRKMQSMAMMQLIQNSGDENMKKLCLEFTKIVDSYEGPQDMPKIKQSLQGFGRTLAPAEE